MSAESPPRHALVVGGARGVGLGISAALLERGWRVTVAGRSHQSPALEAKGAVWRRCDAADPDQAQALLTAAAPYDALIIAAGSDSRRGLFDETAEGFRAQLRDNLDVAFHLLRLGLPPLMAQGWGRVLTFTLSTTHRLQPSPRLPAHAAAKAALLSLTRSAAFEAGPHGVTVNALALGHIQTEHQHHDERAQRGPTRRLGTVQEVVSAALFLLSDEASYINGAELPVSGGYGV
ncbi:MAG: SDR family oxidoreductase [Deltaproteobacteria bacterium]|nr:SDR family oxidoreductase [Deltaproteobacteria bacterium]